MNDFLTRLLGKRPAMSAWENRILNGPMGMEQWLHEFMKAPPGTEVRVGLNYTRMVGGCPETALCCFTELYGDMPTRLICTLDARGLSEVMLQKLKPDNLIKLTENPDSIKLFGAMGDMANAFPPYNKQVPAVQFRKG